MSGKFQYKGILNVEPYGELRLLETTSPPVPKLYQTLSKDNSIMDDIIRRYLPPPSSKPSPASNLAIVVRNVRYIPANAPVGIIQNPTPRRIAKRRIVVNGVRPYSAKNRSTCYWHDAGWEKRGDHLIGHYSVGKKLFPGSVELRDSVVVPAKYYIYNPPYEVLSGPHAACFRERGSVGGREKYWIHFSREPSDIDCGIIQIERDLAQAVGR